MNDRRGGLGRDGDINHYREDRGMIQYQDHMALYDAHHIHSFGVG
jgi:hypothetical protein